MTATHDRGRRRFSGALASSGALAALSPFGIVRAQSKKLKLGVILPLTGHLGFIGQSCKKGAAHASRFAVLGKVKMPSRALAAFASCALVAACATAPSGPGQLATETFMIPAADAGIQLHVRNKHAAGQDRYAPERIVLMVHGATYPSESGFDLDLPGGSWMEYIAKRGYDVYFVDVRGYGRSTRPAAMDQPPAQNPPFADTQQAIRDVGAAVDFILKRRGVSKINLVGWSWGTTIMGGYTAQNNAKVDRLVLYAPLWLLKEPPPFSGSGAYRTANKEQAYGRQVRSIPKDRVKEIVPQEYFDKWWAATLATDPAGAARTPPVVRAPNGVLKDVVQYLGKGRPLWDPAQVRVPTFLILAEWDADTPAYMAQEVFARLVNAPHRRLVILPEGTHAISLEKNRMHLIEQVQLFLEEDRR